MIWRVEQSAIVLLRSMSDRELADMGLARSEIESLVKGKRRAIVRWAAWRDQAAKQARQRGFSRCFSLRGLSKSPAVSSFRDRKMAASSL